MQFVFLMVVLSLSVKSNPTPSDLKNDNIKNEGGQNHTLCTLDASFPQSRYHLFYIPRV